MVKRIFVIISALLVVLLLGSCTFSERYVSKSKIVHFSFDDVESVFYDLIVNKDDYTSIFDNDYLAELRHYHNMYGAKFTLYMYEESSRFRAADIPKKYKKEFSCNSDWLKIGYHWEKPEFRSDIPVRRFKDSFIAVNNSIKEFGDTSCISSTLRLHYYFCPDSLLSCITNLGGGKSIIMC